MNIVSYLISLLFVLFSTIGQAQGYGPTAGSMAAAHFKDGQAAALSLDFKAAIRHFRKAVKEQESLIVARRMIGQCHVQLGEYPEAANEYLQVIKRDSFFSRKIYFELADAYYKMGQAEIALHYFNEFDRLQAYDINRFGMHGTEELVDELLQLDRLAANIRACQLAVDSVKFINITDIVNIGGDVNSKHDDYFPFLSNDQTRLLYTRQKDDGDEDLFQSKLGNQKWKAGERVRKFNTQYPEGMSTLVRNGRRLYFTACARDSVAGPCDIWEAILEGDEVQSVTTLGAPINSEYWESQAAVSCDGAKLFFASNRPGGLGGTDIYMSERLPNGNWGLPVNLGAPLNTDGDEEAPFISNDGQTLYFSSTGHLGNGEQDIFMSWWDDRQGRWSIPINLGPPVNSPHRELGFYLSADGKTGFFASNRPGGQGGMDIYAFELSEQLYGEPITFMEGFVRDSVIRTPVVTTVDINGRSSVKTDDQGRFFLCAGADETLDFSATAEDYHPYHNQFLIPAWDNKNFYTIDLLMKPTFSFLSDLEENPEPEKRERPQLLVVNHSIMFGFDSSELSAQEAERMDALVESLEKLDVVKVEIVGYADDIGVASYNLKLSEERAKNTAVFLLTRQITVNDIHIEGKGTVINDMERTENRRVDIRITVFE